jgi:hypothetical protein
MQRIGWLAVPALLVVVACASPHVVPSAQDAAFRLANLREQQIAIFPIATADLDESISKTMVGEYKDKGAFLDAVARKFSDHLIGICKSPSLNSDQVTAALTASETSRLLLDPSKLLGNQDPNNRFAGSANPESFGSLGQLPAFQGVRYALIPRDLGIGRQWMTQGSAGGGFVSTGPGTGTFVGGSSSSAKTQARLRLAIVDLQAKSIVWDGAVFADASSTFMKATALHEVEEDLVSHFVNEVLGLK